MAQAEVGKAGNGVKHVECKAEYGKGPGAALSMQSASR